MPDISLRTLSVVSDQTTLDYSSFSLKKFHSKSIILDEYYPEGEWQIESDTDGYCNSHI